MDGQLYSDFLIAAAFASPSGPLTGLAGNFVVTATDVSTGSPLVVGAIAEQGTTGHYQATIDAAQLTRRMRLKVVWTNTTNQLYAESFYAIGDIPDFARTRREVRQRVARRVWGDDHLWDEVATGGTTTTAVLPGLTIGGDGEHRGMWAWFSRGSAVPYQRQVTAFDAATDTITVAPALPTTVLAGDRVELYPARPTTINGAIDDALSRLSEEFLVAAEDQTIATDGTTTEWPLPTDVLAVSEVGLVRIGDGEFLGWLPFEQWTTLPGRRLRVSDMPFRDAFDPLDWGMTTPRAVQPGYRLRVWLRCTPSPPLYDESFVCVPVESVVATAAYELLLNAPDEQRRVMLPHYRAEAQRLAVNASSLLGGGTQRVHP